MRFLSQRVWIFLRFLICIVSFLFQRHVLYNETTEREALIEVLAYNEVLPMTVIFSFTGRFWFYRKSSGAFLKNYFNCMTCPPTHKEMVPFPGPSSSYLWKKEIRWGDTLWSSICVGSIQRRKDWPLSRKTTFVSWGGKATLTLFIVFKMECAENASWEMQDAVEAVVDKTHSSS